MEEMLSKEEVLHVADLARISLTDEEISKYQVQLKKLLDDVEKINEVKGYDDDILIACWENSAELRSDVQGEMLDPKKVIENGTDNLSEEDMKSNFEINEWSFNYDFSS